MTSGRRGARLTRLGRSSTALSWAIARRGRVLSPAWRRWLEENLGAGVDPESLRGTLLAEGVPPAEATLRLAEAAKRAARARPEVEDRAERAAKHGEEAAKRAARAEQVLRLRASLRGETIERRPTPVAEEFFAAYWRTNTPVILTDLVRRWPAFHRWSLPALRERFGDLKIEYEGGRAADPECDIRHLDHRRAGTFAEYIDRVGASAPGNDLYLIANNRTLARPGFRPLFEDLILPPGYFAEERLASGSALWLGPAGTVTSLHHDTSNILFCQVVGRKRVRLGAPEDPALLANGRGVYSRLDPESPQLPGPAEGGPHFFDIELAPGEALFIPVGWWHHVRALDRSISVALNAFARANVFDWYKPGALA